MLRELSRVISECHLLASKCEQSARLSRDPRSTQIYSVMERHWNSLAQSYERIERLKESRTDSLPQADETQLRSEHGQIVPSR